MDVKFHAFRTYSQVTFSKDRREFKRILVDFFVLTRGAVCDEARHDDGDHEEDATRLHFSQLTDPSTLSLMVQGLRQRSLSRG